MRLRPHAHSFGTVFSGARSSPAKLSPLCEGSSICDALNHRYAANAAVANEPKLKMALLDEIGELVRVAHVAFGIGCAELSVPCAPQSLACTERSGMRSRTSERARGIGVPDVSERIT
jgi:hypothetical protein